MVKSRLIVVKPIRQAAEVSPEFRSLWDLIASHYQGGPYSVHGPDHWRRVMRNGLAIAAHSGANKQVVQLFALFHDACRWNDGNDPDHGSRGAALARQLRDPWLDLDDVEFELLCYACHWHTHKKHHDDPTIGTCWDADRLDLGRVAIAPSADFMSTDAGRRAARAGTIHVLE